MTELSLSEIESVVGGFQFFASPTKTLLSSIMPDYALPLDFNKQLASLNVVEDYVLKNIESS